MWKEASLGRDYGAALGRALLVLEWKVNNRSNSPTTPIHVICYPRGIVAMYTLRFDPFRGVITRSDVLKI